MARAGNLKPRQRFQAKIPGFTSGSVFLVRDVRPSLDLEDHVRVVATTKRGREKIFRLPNSMKVTIVSRKSKVKPSQLPPPKCVCTNHMGTKKILHPSEDAALKAIMRRHLKYGGHRTYECPTVPGRYHVTSKVDSNT